MCGIAGTLALRDAAPRPDAARLRAMADSVIHRGPDDQGFYEQGPVGFGFRRLAIIDVSMAGHQPMSDDAGEVTIMLNGEIYNYPELRRELEGRGYTFRGGSDTEAVLHGYREWGDDVLTRLNGMFGLAVWDVRRQRLLLARDRAGIKFVYYRHDGDELVFGSELRAVLAAGGPLPSLDPTALNLFLRYRYTPSPLTIYAGISKLAPGTKLVVENGRVAVSRWWDYDPTPLDPAPRPEEAADRLFELYREAVRRQLMSDVPLGLLLSGGVDSALLLALMNEHGAGWPTFTVGYGEGYENDELTDARRTAEIFGAKHTEVRLDRAGFEDDLAAVVDALEEPIASPSMVALYHVCRQAAQDVTVALIGQGPDELLGGYTRHLGVRYGAAWRALPGPLRALAGSGLRRIPRAETIHRGLDSLHVRDRMRRYQQVFSLLPGPLVDGLFLADVLPPGAGDAVLDCWADAAPGVAAGDELSAFSYLEMRSSLPDELLLSGDKLSMAHSLELRVPYLDHEIIEYVGRLPQSLKVRLGQGKWLHKRVASAHLPAEIVRRPKRAFARDVVDGWYRESLDGKVADTLLDPSALLYSILRRDRVRELVDDHRSGRHDRHKIVFSLVVLEDWLRRNLTG
jgi:asparagine synthase (glutamine-hydrolysing)